MLAFGAVADTAIADPLGDLEDADAPAAPTLASPADASSTTDTTPSFDWNDPPDGTLFNIQIDDDPAFGSPIVDDSTLMVSHYTAAPLALGTWYWRVRAANGLAVWGDWSGSRSFIIAAPPAPGTPGTKVGGLNLSLSIGL